jgi:hypothetical protein
MTMDDVAKFVMATVTVEVKKEFGIHVELGKFTLRTPNHALGYGEIPYRHHLTFSRWCKEQAKKPTEAK